MVDELAERKFDIKKRTQRSKEKRKSLKREEKKRKKKKQGHKQSRQMNWSNICGQKSDEYAKHTIVI